MGKSIRRAQAHDAETLRDIYAPSVSDGATSFELVPPDASAMEQKVNQLSVLYPWLVFESAEKVLGYAYASPHRDRPAYRWSVEVSVYVHTDAQGCRVGRALYTSLFELLRRQGYVNAYAGITLPNPASVALHESMGFVPVGVF